MRSHTGDGGFVVDSDLTSDQGEEESRCGIVVRVIVPSKKAFWDDEDRHTRKKRSGNRGTRY